jgi:hypothetical protein
VGSFESFYQTIVELGQTIVELGASGIIMNGDPGEGPILGGRRAEALPPGRGYLVSGAEAR